VISLIFITVLNGWEGIRYDLYNCITRLAEAAGVCLLDENAASIKAISQTQNIPNNFA
jgi:hypothetical protein